MNMITVSKTQGMSTRATYLDPLDALSISSVFSRYSMTLPMFLSILVTFPRTNRQSICTLSRKPPNLTIPAYVSIARADNRFSSAVSVSHSGVGATTG